MASTVPLEDYFLGKLPGITQLMASHTALTELDVLACNI
jgi:hypothetical protein